MPDYNELSSKAIAAVQAAQDYLNRRKLEPTTSPSERERIQDWQRSLEELSTRLFLSASPPPTAAAPYAWTALSEQLDLTLKHIGELHEYFDFGNVDVVLGGLHNQVAMVATHGAGAGNPTGGPRLGR